MRDTVIVTGSSGLIGSAVVRRFAGEYQVVGFDNVGPPHPPPQAMCVSVDLASDESVRSGLAEVRKTCGERIASVIHLAAYYDFSGAPSPKYDEITVRGTQRLLRGLQAFEVEQFIFSSTILVHAPCEPGQRINEDWPLAPKWEYPKSKVRTEELIRKQRGTTPSLILRVAGVYDDNGHSIPIAQQIQRIYEQSLTGHVFPGDLNHGQAFVHLDDVIGAIWRAVDARQQLSDDLILLIGEEESLSYGEVQQLLGRLIHGEEWETYEIPKPLAKLGATLQDLVPGHDSFIQPWMIDLADDHFALDITRARTHLGWEPWHSLRETLPKIVNALTADPAAWYEAHQLTPPDSLTEAAAESQKETADVD
jgi:nucleoside-diphosphate-sugar epimerase